MRVCYSIFLFLFYSVSLAQSSDIKKISKEACTCLDDIDQGLEKTKIYEEISSCIEASITQEQFKTKLFGAFDKIKNDSIEKAKNPVVNDSTDATENINITIITDLDYDDIEEYLLRNCDRMQQLMTTENNQSEVSVSNNENAIRLYEQGMEFYRVENYEEAIAKFKMAIKADSNFAYAYDMVGISYRRKKDYKKAIKFYEKSLKIDPLGRMPLMNIPIAYAMMNKYDKAIDGYNEFIKVFPEDPEGFYGIGRIYHMQGDYENALENTMKAYKMYTEIESPYARDAEANLALFYKELKQKNQLPLFNRLAKKHDIKIGE